MKNQLDGGEAVLDACRALGVDYIISSPGSEWSPLWEAMAHQTVSNAPGPAYIDCWHETLAVDMAMGYTLITGRPQAVLLHAGAGLLQGAMGMHAATLCEVPMLIMSGESLTYGENPELDIEPQWYRSLSIVGGPQRLVEPVVKWANQATSPYTLYESVVRAGEMAQRVPAGPTYLCVGLETMLHPWTPPPHRRNAPLAVKPQARTEDIAAIAQLLLNARQPVIITESAGRDPEAFTALVALAELYGAPVLGGRLNACANFPKSHPLSLSGSDPAFDPQTDLILLLNSRSPWYPPHRRPSAQHIIAVGDNPLKTNMVYQSLQADLYLEGDLATSLRLLIEAGKQAGLTPSTHESRRAHWSAQHAAQDSKRQAAEAKAQDSTGIDPITLLAVLGELMPKDTIWVDETISHSELVQTHIPWDQSQSFFRVIGGLGQGLGLSLGLKLAAKQRPVTLLVGDGSFLYNPMVQALGASRDYQLPVLAVIFNNGKYNAMKKGHVKYYEGGISDTHNVYYGVNINGPNYNDLAGVFGFHGAEITRPEDLRPALKAAQAALASGQSAILNVHVTR
jgi:acetolactate synthase I/II/III large subunit